jgi:hypothetical protein
MISWLENLYRALWSRVGGKPWTEIIREDQKKSPLVFLLVFADWEYWSVSWPGNTVADTARLLAGNTLRTFLVVRDMEGDFVSRLREQERILARCATMCSAGWMTCCEMPSTRRRSCAMLLDWALTSRRFPDSGGTKDGFDAYRVLGLEKTATDGEVKTRYRELLKKLHPDTAGVRGTDFCSS